MSETMMDDPHPSEEYFEAAVRCEAWARLWRTPLRDAVKGTEMPEQFDSVAAGEKTRSHRHRCMRCGQEFDCLTPGVCQAQYDVLPRMVTADSKIVEHCQPAAMQAGRTKAKGDTFNHRDVAILGGDPSL